MLSTVKKTVPCAHCGLPTLSGIHDSPVFCCHGCQGAYALIHQLGLESFYDLQAVTKNQSAPGKTKIDASKERWARLDALASQAVETPDGFCSIRLSVNGIHCAACAWLIEKLQPHLHGVQSTRVRMNDHSIQVTYDPKQTSLSQIAEPLSKLGYTLAPMSPMEDRDAMRVARREHWWGIAVAFFLAANSMWIGIALYAGESTGMTAAHATFLRCVGASLGALAAVFPGRIFFETAFQAIRTRTPHVDIPVALAIGVGTISSIIGCIVGYEHIYFDSIAALILLLRVGRYLQFRAQYQTGLSLDRLFRWNTAFATRINEESLTETVATTELRPGETILVKAGESFPADGRITQGESTVDCAWLTGESQPIEVHEGDTVVGGTLNLRSPLRMRVNAVGEASRVGSLNQLIRQAASQKTPLIQLADRVGGWFVWTVLGLSLGTFIAWTITADVFVATRHTVSLLTIACPCALALAAPLVITVAIGRAAGHSIWIHDGNVLEMLSRPGIAWFDKTGTLTQGKFRVLDWTGDDEALKHAAILEMHSTHPVAEAIVTYASSNAANLLINQSSNDFSIEQVLGRGIHGRVLGRHVAVGTIEWMEDQNIHVASTDRKSYQAISIDGNTPLIVAIDRTTRGVFSLGDTLRPDAVKLIKDLDCLGWKVGILSGDRQEVVETIAIRLGLLDRDGCHFIGELTPEDKLAIVQASKNKDTGNVIMIGDGINDAAALMVADVGIAVRSSDDLSLRSAPVYIPGDRLSAVVELIDASRASIRSIHRCFAASLLYNMVTISLAIAGLMHPLVAAVLMPISGLTVLMMALSSRTFSKKPAAYANTLTCRPSHEVVQS
jgi:P-type Cu2+ transporter